MKWIVTVTERSLNYGKGWSFDDITIENIKKHPYENDFIYAEYSTKKDAEIAAIVLYGQMMYMCGKKSEENKDTIYISIPKVFKK